MRIGSGAYVKKLLGAADAPEFNVTAIELTEARLLIEGEAAALAATNLTDDGLNQLDALVARMADEREGESAQFAANKAFHLLIARGTRNAAMIHAVEELWRMHASSPESALLHDKARDAKVTPVIDGHSAIVAALRSGDAGKARIEVMRAAKPNGAALLIMPGGGYRYEVIDKEGYDVARWYTAHGVTGFVLNYRFPSDGWASVADAPG